MALIHRGIIRSFDFHRHISYMVIIVMLVTLLSGHVVAREHPHEHMTKHDHGVLTTNSCTVTWISAAAKPAKSATIAFSRPITDIWSLRSAVAGDLDYYFEHDHLGMNEEQYQLYHKDRIHAAIDLAECVIKEWPVLDLDWCLVDWHDGKLIKESL